MVVGSSFACCLLLSGVACVLWECGDIQHKKVCGRLGRAFRRGVVHAVFCLLGLR